MAEQRLNFKAMCSMFQVTPRTLRYYEYIELLTPDREGRSRFYGPREVARMKLILRGRKFGFSLEEIRQWLGIYEERGTDAQLNAFLGLADRQLVALSQQHSALTATIKELESLRAEVASSIGDFRKDL